MIYDLIDKLLPILATLLGTALTSLLIWIFHKIGTRFHIGNMAAYDAQITNLVYTAVNAAEQKSAEALKAGAAELSASDKLKIATDWVNSELERMGLPQVAAEYLTMRVQALLFAKSQAKQAK